MNVNEKLLGVLPDISDLFFSQELMFSLGSQINWVVNWMNWCEWQFVKVNLFNDCLSLCDLLPATRDELTEGRKEMFYLMTHSTHFIYGYMASGLFNDAPNTFIYAYMVSDIW